MKEKQLAIVLVLVFLFLLLAKLCHFVGFLHREIGEEIREEAHKHAPVRFNDGSLKYPVGLNEAPEVVKHWYAPPTDGTQTLMNAVRAALTQPGGPPGNSLAFPADVYPGLYIQAYG